MDELMLARSSDEASYFEKRDDGDQVRRWRGVGGGESERLLEEREEGT